MLGGQRGQGLLVGGVLAGLGLLGRVADLEQVEEHLPELPGRVQVERGPGEAIDGLLGLVHLFRKLPGELRERGGIHPDALELHAHEHGNQRRLHLVEHPLLALFLEQRLERRAKLPGHVGILGGVFGDLRHGHIGHVDLLPLQVADQPGDGDGRVA